VDVQIEATLLGNALSALPGFSTSTLDLSAGGVRIAVPEELPMGLAVSLMLHFPDGLKVTTAATVVRSSPWPERDGDRGPWAALEFADPPRVLESLLGAAGVVPG
jgi:hypothetical protein